MPARLNNLLFFFLALPAVLRAAWRLRRLASRYRLDQLVDELRRVPRFRHRRLTDPQRLAACADRWVTFWGRTLGSSWLVKSPQGPCYQRSLLLLDLWARCGLRPELQLGAVQHLEGRHLHAWVTTEGGPACGVSTHAVVWTG